MYVKGSSLVLFLQQSFFILLFLKNKNLIRLARSDCVSGKYKKKIYALKKNKKKL